MSVHERAWRVTDTEGSRIVHRGREASAARAAGAVVKAVRWEVAWREGAHQRTKRFTQERAARRYDVEVQRRAELGEPILRRRDVPTLTELAERWFAQREADVVAGDLAPQTLTELAGLLDDYIVPSLGHLRLVDLRAGRLDEWVSELRSERVSAYRIRRGAGLLSRLLGYAVRLEYLPGNPARELELPAHRYRRGRTATPIQVERMRAWFLERDRLGDATLVSILAEGLRPAEALAATWRGFDGRRVRVEAHLRDGESIAGTKRGRRAEMGPPRWVELADPHAADLAEWRLALGRPHGLIFPRAADGLGWRKYDWDNWRKRSFRPAAGAAGLLRWDRRRKVWTGDFRPYDLRHTAASLMIAAGRPVAEVADHLGHGVDVCMRTYAHLIEEMKGKPQTPVADAIRAARAELGGEDVGDELGAEVG